MKKIVYILSTALLVLSACSKEADSLIPSSNSADAHKSGYVLRASISDFSTKAEIAEATGIVTFNTGDAFIIQGDDNNWYTFTTSESGASVNFVCPDAPSTVSFVGKEASYPTDKFIPSSQSWNMPTAYASPKDALKNGIFMSGKVSAEGTLAFTHNLAGMIKVTFNNVPEFADNVYFENGSRKTEVSLAGANGDDVVVYCPIYYQAGSLTVSLRDASDNVILQKSTTIASGQQGKLYALKPLTVGRVITFDNQAKWANPRATIWHDSDGDFVFKSIANDPSATYPWKLNQIDANTYYFVINNDVVNDNGHNFGNDDYVGIWFGNDDGNETKTDCVYLYRDIKFTIPEGGGMKTAYRCYARFSDAKWEEWKNAQGGAEVVKFNGYWFTDSEDNKFANWIDCERTTPTSKVFYYEFPEDYYGYSNIGYKFYNPSDTSKNKGNTAAVVVNRDFMVEFVED